MDVSLKENIIRCVRDFLGGKDVYLAVQRSYG